MKDARMELSARLAGSATKDSPYLGNLLLLRQYEGGAIVRCVTF